MGKLLCNKIFCHTYPVPVNTFATTTLMPVQHRAQQQHYKKATLYAYVFDSSIVKMCVLILFSLLLLQPIAPAYAALDEETLLSDVEKVVEITPVIVEENVESIPASVAELSSEEVLNVSSEEVAEPEPVSTLSTSTLGFDTNDTDISITEVNSSNELPSDQNGTTSLPIFNDHASTSTSTTTENTTETLPQEVLVETPVVELQSVASTSATTTEIVEEVSVHNSSAFSFDTTECAVVGEGEFYCNENKAEPKATKDGVFSAPDRDGDLEIYVAKNGEQVQLTHNTTDDGAPYFDGLSERIVWHSMVSDRYQIFSYDLKSSEMTRLTDSNYNNMEPVAYGEVTLWQAWIDNNWEIMLFDGQTQRQITNNTQNDVSPHMREGYIVWQTQFDDAWQVAVYDQETKEVEYIASEGGLKVQNPRFVLVYDSTDKNGDMKTVGYDFDSKSSFDLGVLPQELPEELPEPDQTGETRALIQNKQTSREGESEVTIVPQDTGSTPNATTTPTDTQGSTLDLSQGTSTVSTVVQTSSTSPSIADVVLQSYASSTPVSQDRITIPAVVIPPYISTSTLEIS